MDFHKKKQVNFTSDSYITIFSSFYNYHIWYLAQQSPNENVANLLLRVRQLLGKSIFIYLVGMSKENCYLHIWDNYIFLTYSFVFFISRYLEFIVVIPDLECDSHSLTASAIHIVWWGINFPEEQPSFLS